MAPRRRLALALLVLDRLTKAEVSAKVKPRALRERLFGEAAQASKARDMAAVWQSAAVDLGMAIAVLREDLFADLPGERVIRPLEPELTPDGLMLRANQMLVQSLLARASSVVIEMDGHAGHVVRHARGRGLICSLAARGGEKAALELSGPLSLFRRTLLYGRALGSLVPALAWCARFELRASCVIAGQHRELVIASGAPILPSKPPPAFDSRLEERFAREFRRLTTEWDLLREPAPVRAGRSLALPDFAIERRATGERWLVEIVGFWTREYLEKKLALYRAAQLPNLVLAIDADRCCDDGALPDGARVVRFRGRRLDPASVLAAIGAPLEG